MEFRNPNLVLSQILESRKVNVEKEKRVEKYNNTIEKSCWTIGILFWVNFLLQSFQYHVSTLPE